MNGRKAKALRRAARVTGAPYPALEYVKVSQDAGQPGKRKSTELRVRGKSVRGVYHQLKKNS